MKLITDFIINIFSTIFPIAILQFFILPKLSKTMGIDEFGLILTILSLFSLVSESLGNVLNNVRLLENEKYKNEKIDENFNLILLLISIFNIIFIVIGLYIYDGNLNNLKYVIIISVLILSRAYFIVLFRLELNYKKIFYNNIFLGVGYVIGYLLFLKFKNWTIIYIIGNLLPLIHIVFFSSIVKRIAIVPFLLKNILKKFSILYIADLLKTFINYADKLLLYPLMGADIVAYYYAATIVGKIFASCISPITSVVLSYLVKISYISRKQKILILQLLFCIGGISFFILLKVGDIVILILYQEWRRIIFSILPLVTLGIILNSIGGVLQAFILRFKGEKYQIFINSLNLIIYILLIISFRQNDLETIAELILISNIIKFFIILYFFRKI